MGVAVAVVLTEGVGRLRASRVDSMEATALALLPCTLRASSLASVVRAAVEKSNTAAKKVTSRGISAHAARAVLSAATTLALSIAGELVPGKRRRPLTTGCPMMGAPVGVVLRVRLALREAVRVGKAVGRVAVGEAVPAEVALWEALRESVERGGAVGWVLGVLPPPPPPPPCCSPW